MAHIPTKNQVGLFESIVNIDCMWWRLHFRISKRIHQNHGESNRCACWWQPIERKVCYPHLAVQLADWKVYCFTTFTWYLHGFDRSRGWRRQSDTCLIWCYPRVLRNHTGRTRLLQDGRVLWETTWSYRRPIQFFRQWKGIKKLV